MKKSLFFVWVSFLTFLLTSVYKGEAQTTIELQKAGSLKEKLASQTELSHLIIKGPLNADDFGVLRVTTGIQKLDLSQVKIEEGGTYIGNPYMSEKVGTKPNVMPQWFLYESKLKESLTSITLPESVTRLDKRALQDGEKLTEIVLPSALTYLGEMSLGYCKSLESISIPESVDSICGSTFEHCEALSEITLPEKLRYLGGAVFSACKSLSEIEIPQFIDKINFATFKQCSALASVQLPPFVKSIEKFAFEECTALEKIELPYLLHSIESFAFKGCTSLSEVEFHCQALSKIGDQAFRGCKSLEQIIIPAGVKVIGGLAFSECEALSKVILPAHLNVIMGGSFAGTALEDVVIPNNCSEIGYGAFANCANLKLVSLPKNLKKIGEVAFGNCESLKLVIANNLKACEEEQNNDLQGLSSLSSSKELILLVPKGGIDSYRTTKLWKEFSNIEEGLVLEAELTTDKRLQSILETLEKPLLYEKVILTGTITKEDLESLFNLPCLQEFDLSRVTFDAEDNPFDDFTFGPFSFLRIIQLPATLKGISDKAFGGATHLETITLPKELTAIGAEAFAFCTSLKNISLPSTIKEIGEAAFVACTSLIQLNLPDEVEFLPDFVLTDCISLQKLTLPKKCSDIGKMAFTNCTSLKNLILPESVTDIKEFVFTGCDSFESIECLGATPPALSEDAFNEKQYKSIKVIVATEEIKNNYKEADVWKLFENYVIKKKTDTAEKIDVDNILSNIVVTSDKQVKLHLYKKRNEVAIYSPSGVLCFYQILSNGEYTLPLNNGNYIVKIDGKSFKFSF